MSNGDYDVFKSSSLEFESSLPPHERTKNLYRMNQTDGSKFYRAARAGDVKVIQQLLSKIDVKQPADKDWLDRSLAQAVHVRSVETVDLLLKAGANPDQKTSIGTLLSGAAMDGDLPLVKRLIEAGANVNREIKRETALSAALSENQVAVIEYLEKLGAYSPPSTTLIYACQHGDIKRAKEALAEGADVEKVGGMFEETPLLAAAWKGQVESVKFLLKNGANPNNRINENRALFAAVAIKNLELFDLLVAARADMQSKYYGKTLLMAAAEVGCIAIVKRLVELGVDVNARDKNCNKTALDCAKTAKKNEVIDYLNSLGAKSEREAGRALMKALTKEYGGKPVEDAHGIKGNSNFAGSKCEFHIFQAVACVKVFKLNYTDTEFKRVARPGVVIGHEMSKVPKVEVKSASKILNKKVMRPPDSTGVSDGFVTDFCKRHREFFKQLNLSGKELVGISSDTARFWWTVTDITKILPRLKLFENFIQEISRPAEPERRLFEKEWLIQPAPKTGDAKSVARHTLGGTLETAVACPLCGLATNLMARIDWSDPALPKTPLSAGKLPVFWCLDCGEWDAAFFDISNPTPKAMVAKGKAANAGSNETGEEDLPERRVTLVPVPPGKKAGRKSKIGGSPSWIQSESTPDCPKCEKPMAFVLQLASDSRISYCDMGMLYNFACPDCKVSASLIQSH